MANRDLLYTRHPTRAQVAQLVEQRIENPRVTGSIPVQATKFNRRITFCTTAVFFCASYFIEIPC